MSYLDHYTIGHEQVGAAPCRGCTRTIRGRALVVRYPFYDGTGSVNRHYCDAGCASNDGFGWLVAATMPLPRVTVKAAVEAANANRATWHPSPIEDYHGDDRRREWTALCNESRKLNRRD